MQGFQQTVPCIYIKKYQLRLTFYFDSGCDDDWIEYGGHCYFIGPSKVTWGEAKVKDHHISDLWNFIAHLR